MQVSRVVGETSGNDDFVRKGCSAFFSFPFFSFFFFFCLFCGFVFSDTQISSVSKDLAKTFDKKQRQSQRQIVLRSHFSESVDVENRHKISMASR